MIETLPSPNNPADAIFVVRSLRDQQVVPELAERFGQAPLEDTQANALAWMQKTIDTAHPPLYIGGKLVRPGRDAFDLDATLPPGLEETLNEPPLTTKKPEPFDEQETKIVLAAVRMAAREPKTRAVAEDFLARLAPSKRRRFVRLTGLAAVAALLHK